MFACSVLSGTGVRIFATAMISFAKRSVDDMGSPRCGASSYNRIPFSRRATRRATSPMPGWRNWSPAAPTRMSRSRSAWRATCRAWPACGPSCGRAWRRRRSATARASRAISRPPIASCGGAGASGSGAEPRPDHRAFSGPACLPASPVRRRRGGPRSRARDPTTSPAIRRRRGRSHSAWHPAAASRRARGRRFHSDSRN